MSILGGQTFRNAIDSNKRNIIAYLTKLGRKCCTADIEREYGGERGMSVVRKALNELRKEGHITTDDKVHFWQGKFWELTHKP